MAADDSDLDDRKTQKFSAGHFQALIGTMDTPPIEIAPPVVCEEVASGSLIAEAIAQIKAGARVTLDTAESVPLRVVEEVVNVASELSAAPTTQPSAPANPVTTEIAEIAVQRTRSRPAVKMSRITKPPPIKRQPTAPIEIPEPLEIDEPRDIVAQVVAVRPAFVRALSEPETVAPARSSWRLVFGSMLVLALMATIVILLQSR